MAAGESALEAGGDHVLIVDAANVVGSRPNGWWRDRPGAARALVAQLHDATEAGQLPMPVIVVLEGRAKGGADEGTIGDVTVVHAERDGDEAIVALSSGETRPIVLVSADRALRSRVAAEGATAVGPSWLWGRIEV